MTAHAPMRGDRQRDIVAVPKARSQPNEGAILRVLALLGGETEPGDFEYGAVMADVYEVVAVFRDRHVQMFEAYEDGLNAEAARFARLAAEEAYAVGDSHARLARVFEGMTDRPIHPTLRHGSDADGY
jgi:hypothetical protein